jgi:hypothetical protein
VILVEWSNVTPEKIVAELAVIAFSDLGDYIRIHQDGTASIELGNMPLGATRAIASLNTDTSRTAADNQVTKLRFKLHDKHAALVSLAKILGMFQESSVNLTIESHDSSKLAVLSTEDLRRVLDSGVFDNQADTHAEDAERPCLREVSTPSESDE